LVKLSPSINRIVVRAPNWVGDAVMSVAAFREVRRLLPNAHIAVVSKPGTSDIFRGADFVDEVLVYERGGLSSVWRQIREWKQRSFDLALLFQNAFEAAAISYLARVPQRIGYDTERRGFLLTQPVAVPLWKNERHEIFYYLNLVAELEQALLGRSRSEAPEPHFQIAVSAQRQEDIRKLLAADTEPDKPLALLCPGSVNSRAKRWPAERYAALADQLAESGTTVALIGSPGELEVSKQVVSLAKRPPVLLTGKTSVAEVTALISVADVLVTNDTGPAHIGAAVGTPTLVIFGPTNPLTTRPYGSAGKVIRHPPDCAPCMLRDCPIDHRCMTAILPEEVFQRTVELIRRHEEVPV
jgi:lipopolysaccharide heptosyltransferase II